MCQSWRITVTWEYLFTLNCVQVAHVRHGERFWLAGWPGRHPLHDPRGSRCRHRAGELRHALLQVSRLIHLVRFGFDWGWYQCSGPFSFWQCCGVMTFWFVSGSADPYLQQMDPDPFIFVINLRDAKKTIKKKFFCLLLFKGTLFHR